MLVHKNKKLVWNADSGANAATTDSVVIGKPTALPRAGWNEAGRAIAACGDDALVLPDFANAESADLEW